jgi:DNA-binding response OmpR family regulator
MFDPVRALQGGPHIVIADELPPLLDFMVRTLRGADYCVFQAYDGLSAYELTLGLRVVDLLITNTKMPGLSGPELIHQIRRQLPALPILYIRNPGAGPLASLPPDVITLEDPFTPEQLLAAVRTLLPPHD